MMFRYYKAMPFELPMRGEMSFEPNDFQQVILCLSGEGEVWMEDAGYVIKQGDVFFIPSSQEIRLLAGEQLFRGCFVYFDAYEENSEQCYIRMPQYRKGPSIARDWPQMLKCCDQLLSLHTAEPRNRLLEQSVFYQLIGLAVQEQTVHKQEETTDEAIERVSAFMEQYYEKEHSRLELARLAGLSQGYFSSAFQQYMGKSPTAFLLDIRMAHAQQLLLAGEGVKETAGKVGFDDEFYFSRRFKKQTGLSPVAFVKSRCRNIASTSDPLSANLLALRLLPRAAALYAHHELNSRMTRLHSCELGRGDVWETNLTMLRQTAPEMIFCTDFLDERSLQELERIAPTVQIDWMGMDWRQHFSKMAESAGHQSEAQIWLSNYAYKAEAAYRKVRGKYGGATLNIWRIMDSQYRIYGERNAGTVLYGDLQFASTYKVDDVYEIVSKEAMSNYDADILLVMVDPTAQSARTWESFRASDEWTKLKAVRSGRAYQMGTDKLLEYSALSHERALTYVTEMLR
ncbi:helix-turn-helix domain-containing protein [Paenibacillus alba]|uniref:helix-turn-helix domain-containing protein n=1 Tax=Paenibacillus alba TaxID=1197127 RepID=UPI001566DFFB|nr:helix-turn-helix domain-containing protein [Paenibacillus alba]NQX68744.1 helix-turn-helix domain-containing protein [Paenibacillus alba]